MKIVNPYRDYDYLGMMEEARRLRNSYPNLIELGEIGKSVQGRSLLRIRLGQGATRIFLVGAHHGREYLSSALLMRMCEYYCLLWEKRASCYDVRELLKRVTFFVVPMLNPDGVQISIYGEAVMTRAQKEMKMIGASPREWKANANGVDLNRHYPCLFEKKEIKVTQPASELFKGYSAGTEPEVQAAMRFCLRNNFDLAATFHTKGEEIFYADANTPSLISHSRRIAWRVAHLTGYSLAPVSRDPKVFAAGFENWFRERMRRPCLLFELAPYDGPVPSDMREFDTLVWDKVKNIGLELAQILLESVEL